MSNNEEKKQREKFVISLEEHEKFPNMASTTFITSHDFCKLVSELFHGVFADFEGCKFDGSIPGGSLSLIFNHGKYDESAYVACELASAKNSGNSTLNRLRQTDLRNSVGDRFYLTEDGKDAVASLLIPRAFNNGNPNWGDIVKDVIEQTPASMYMAQQQPHYTKVDFIDLRRLCALIYGDKDEDGDAVEYQVMAGATLAQTFYPGATGPAVNDPSANRLLQITRVSLKQLTAISEKLGFGVAGTNIIR